MSSKKIFIGILSLAVLAGLGFLLFGPKAEVEPEPNVVREPEVITEIIGNSVEGREITAHTYGNGENHIVLVGTIHGGYEWNTAILSYDLQTYLEANKDLIPENVSVTVIPVLNPDGLHNIIGTTERFDPNIAPPVKQTEPGRFNANAIDLNRNFDCNWAPESTWRGNVVSAGTEAFSEPEARAFRDFAIKTQPDVVIFYHSAGDGVYSSACNEGVLPETETLMNIYATASGYPARGLFDAYPITGDAEGWLATLGIPGLTVELTTHETIEFEENLAGVKDLLQYYGNK